MTRKGEVIYVDFILKRVLFEGEDSFGVRKQVNSLLKNSEIIKKRLQSMMMESFGISLSTARFLLLYREIEKSIQPGEVFDLNVSVLNQAIANIYDTMNGATIANNNIGDQLTLQKTLTYDNNGEILSFLQDICTTRNCSMADLNAGRVLLFSDQKESIKTLLMKHSSFRSQYSS